MLLIMERKISIIYIIFINTVSWELLFHARLQFPFPTDRFCGILCIESPWLVGALGDRERLAGLGLMDGFLGTGGLHLGSLKKKSHTHLFVFNTNERFRQMDLLLACFSFFFCFFSLSCEIYFISFEMFQGKHLCFESLNSSLS